MATVDIDTILPIDEIAEPVIITLSIEEAREVAFSGMLPLDAHTDVEQFIDEYDAGEYN